MVRQCDLGYAGVFDIIAYPCNYYFISNPRGTGGAGTSSGQLMVSSMGPKYEI